MGKVTSESTADSESRKEDNETEEPSIQKHATQPTSTTPKIKAPLDMTPVDVVQLLFDFTPDVGLDTSKISVTVTMRLLFLAQVSFSLIKYRY